MGLFDGPLKELENFLSEKQKQGLVKELSASARKKWPSESSLILEEDAALELGNPSIGSLSFLVWSEDPEKKARQKTLSPSRERAGRGGSSNISNPSNPYQKRLKSPSPLSPPVQGGEIRVGEKDRFPATMDEQAKTQDRILLIGPDLKEVRQKSIPFGQIVRVWGKFRDEYECFRELREAVLDTRLKGFMVRALPSQQTVWCRVNQLALDQDFSLAHLGAALLQSLKKINFVSSAEIIFVTSGKSDLEKLKQAGEETEGITGALMKMGEEKSFDCSSCDYQEVCDKIEELKMIKKKLQKKAPN